MTRVVVPERAIGASATQVATGRLSQILAANIVFVLTIFPFFQIVPVLSSEVQPVAGVIGFGVWLFGGRKSGLAAALAPLLCVLALYGVVAVTLVELGAAPSQVVYTAEAVAIILAPVGVLLCLKPRIHLLSPQVLTWCMALWAGLGTLQLFASSLLLRSGVSGLLALAIPRTSSQSALAATGRGVDMFAPEPSYAAASIVFMMAAAAWMFATGAMGRRRFALLVALALWMTFLNQSVTLAITLVGGAMVVALVTARRHPITLLTALILGVGGLFTLSSAQHSASRPIRVAAQLATVVTTGDLNLDSLLAVSTLNGNGRLATVVQGYAGAAANDGLGLGLGSWASQITAADNGTIVTSTALKPFGYAPFVAMTLGFPGLVALLYALARLGAQTCRAAPRSLAVATVFVAVIGIIANSPASLPSYWAVLIFGYAYSQAPTGIRMVRFKEGAGSLAGLGVQAGDLR